MLEYEQRRGPGVAVAEKRLPWFVDAFFYPVNVCGLWMLGLFVLLPFVLNLICWLLSSAGMIVPAIFLGRIFSFVELIIMFYMFWYFGFCIRESADGNFRAPDNVAPDFDDGVGETIRQTFMILGVIAVCLFPSIVYYLVHDSIDLNYWLILAGGGFFLPMALLSVIIQDGIWGLNPFRIILSILRTIIQYCFVVLMFYVPIALIVCFMMFVYNNGNVLTYLLFQGVQIYLLFVASHILGRFYHNNEERLRWF